MTHALGTRYVFVYLCFAVTCLLFINLLINKCSWLVNHDAAAADTNQRNTHTHNTNNIVGATTSQMMLTTACECTLKCSTRRYCLANMFASKRTNRKISGIFSSLRVLYSRQFIIFLFSNLIHKILFKICVLFSLLSLDIFR